MDKALEKQTIAKVSWRLLPLIVVIYFVAYIDRTNVGFAAIGMKIQRVRLRLDSISRRLACCCPVSSRFSPSIARLPRDWR
jgi:hypothetical protein